MSIESIQKDLAAKIDSLKCQPLRFTNDGGLFNVLILHCYQSLGLQYNIYIRLRNES